MRLIGYVRCSTTGQATDGYSLPAQTLVLTAWAEREGHELVTIIPDVMSSQRTARMHGRAAAVRLVEVGVADGLAIIRWDRATRGTLDGAQLLETSRKARRPWPILTTDGRNSLDDSQAFMTDIDIARAAQERRDISRRTKDGLAAARAAGKQLGRPHTPDPKTERRMLSLHTAGESARGIAERFNREGIPTPTGTGSWTHSTVLRTLRRIEQEDAA